MGDEKDLSYFLSLGVKAAADSEAKLQAIHTQYQTWLNAHPLKLSIEPLGSPGGRGGHGGGNAITQSAARATEQLERSAAGAAPRTRGGYTTKSGYTIPPDSGYHAMQVKSAALNQKLYEAEEKSGAQRYRAVHRQDVAYEREQRQAAQSYHREQEDANKLDPDYRREQWRKQWSSDYRAKAGDAATPEGEARYVMSQFAKKLKETEEALTPVERMFSLIGQGQLRRGVAVGVTGMLGGGKAAELMGGFSGTLASSLFLPLSWALGNAIASIPATVGDRVQWQRKTEVPSAMASTDWGAENWRTAVSDSREYWGQFRSADKAEKMSDVIMDAAVAAKLAGPAIMPGDITGEEAMAKRVGSYLNQGAALHIAGIMPTSEYAAMMSEMDTVNGVDAARKKFLSIPIFGNAWKQARIDEKMNPLSADLALKQGLGTPQSMLSDIEKRTGQVDSTSVTALKELAQQVVRMDPRISGVIEQQSNQWRLSPRRNWFFRDASNLNADEEDYLDRMQRYQVKLSTTDFDDTDKRTAIRKDMARYKQFETVGVSKEESIGTIDQHQHAPVLTPARAAALDRIAEAEAGDYRRLPGMGYGPQHETTTNARSDYQWTSFAGLAEQMQTMWSGALPVDITNERLADVNTTMKHLDDTIQGAKTGGSVIPTWFHSLLPGIF